jgi:hypothetical protein
VSEPAKPSYCDERRSWLSVGTQRQFWVSSAPEARFEVRREDVVLATCAISDGRCVFDVREPAAEN